MKILPTLICLMLAATTTTTTAGPMPLQDGDVTGMFDPISTLRAEGRYDQAIAELQKIIKQYTESDEILMRAYNELVFSLLQKSEAETDPVAGRRIYNEAEAQAERALTRYPNLVADPNLVSGSVQTVYNSVRARIFGTLAVTSDPDSCNVFVDGVHKGATPLDIAYFPVGDFTLTLTKSGYVDESISLTVLPSRVKEIPVSLRQERTKKWWLTRVFAPVGAGLGAIAALIIANQPEDPLPPEEADPLPGPPDPPTQ